MKKIATVKKKSVTKNYIYNLIYQILVIVLPLITTPYISGVLGAEKIGIYSFTTSIATYFILFGSLGVAMYAQREIAYVQDDEKKRSKLFWEIFFFRCITMAISIIAFYFTYASHGEYQLYYKILIIQLFANVLDISWFFQGLEEFKKLYCKPLGNNVQTLELNDVSASEQVLPTTDSEEETEPEVVEDQTEIVEDPYAYENDSENENESECQTEDSEVYSASEEKENTQSKVIKYCNEMCIYNSDGSFKGFTEGQIVSMLSHLKELDKRIAMDTLNPEYILTEDELRNAAPFLDTIAPSVFKAFITYLVLNASSETDRIRSSVMLDNLCSFLNSMN